MDGQLSIFDFLNTKKEISEPISLKAGQVVFKVLRGDVIKCLVDDRERWYIGEKVYGYNLVEERGCYWSLMTSEIGNIFFLDRMEAEEKARQYLQSHEVILAEEIKKHVVEFHMYSYIRECDSREMVAYYAILDDGKVYIRGFMIYAHICQYESVEQARKAIKKNKDFSCCEEKPMIPKFKNMYRCKEKQNMNTDGWVYAEAEYNG